ncbi:MAG TPA: hypothetical protein DCO79_03830, partial [Spirochaeta sp.]|nr:hypothetical protein [Spirochaeta sp.]
MKQKISAIILFIILSSGFCLHAQQNPFLSSGSEQNETVSGQPADTRFSPFINSSLMQNIRKAQKKIQAWISDYISEYRSSGEIKALFRFMLFSFLYGLLHVLGPGHRKIFLFSYFISQPSRWKQGMFAGFMTAVLHALSAVIFIGGLYLITSRALLTRFNDITPLLERISYGAIIAVGIFIITAQIIESVKGGEHSDHGRKPDTL